jgi:hypothetical protein
MITSDKPVRRLERNAAHQKYFTRDGREVVGASTPARLGHDIKGLLNWYLSCGRKMVNPFHILARAGVVGSISHHIIRCYIEDWKADLSEFSQSEIAEAEIPANKFWAWWQEQDFVPVGTEVQLVSEKYGYGGTIDVLARDAGGRLILVDWKSSSGIWPDHLCQLSAYEQLVHENRQEQVFKRVIVRGGKDDDEGDFEQRWLGPMDSYFNVFKAQLALYNAMREPTQLALYNTMRRPK